MLWDGTLDRSAQNKTMCVQNNRNRNKIFVLHIDYVYQKKTHKKNEKKTASLYHTKS